MYCDTLTLRNARVRCYVPDVSAEIDPKRCRPTVVVCPGGGYEFCSEREAEPVALRLVGMGLNAFVVNYQVAPQARFPQALAQVACAVAHVRENAQRYHADPDKIAIMGFSAGGHLACSLGVFWNKPWLSEITGLSGAMMKPNGMMLSYPVISSGPSAHRGSINSLLGDEAQDPEKLALVSLEKQVTPDTAPAFIWHTFDDDVVPVANSLNLALALREHNVGAELHIYPHGAHGLSLADETVYGDVESANAAPECREWIQLSVRWLRAL